MPKKSKIVVEPEIVRDSVSKLITDMDGVKVIKADKFPDLIMDLFGGEEIDINKFKTDEYGNQPVMLVDEKIYKMNLEKCKKEISGCEAQKRYREKNRDKYNTYQNRLYKKLKDNEEWTKNRNLKAKEANKKYREKKRAEKIEGGQIIKPRGRPKKLKQDNNN